jgi:hypothetical protein
MKKFMKAFFIPKDVLGLDYCGMNLRDYFAAQAPIYLDDAFECLQNSTKSTLTEKYDEEVIDELARLSYAYADAMMKAREQ